MRSVPADDVQPNGCAKLIRMSAVVRAEGLTKRFGSHAVFANADFEISVGVWGLLGDNGAGKTTLMGLMLGLLTPDAGILETLGGSPHRNGPATRARIGYSPEHQLFPSDLPAIDFVRHVCELHGIPRNHSATRASDALWWVDLGEERFRALGTLSVGQRQRVKLAAAMAFDPALLLLDEPTDGLDPAQRDAMLALVSRVGSRSGMTIVMASHLLDEVERTCDRVLVLDGGIVRDLGPMNDTQRAPEAVDVTIDGDADSFATWIEQRGVVVTRSESSGRRLSIAVPAATSSAVSYRDLLVLIQESASINAVGIRRMMPVRTGLAERMASGS